MQYPASVEKWGLFEVACEGFQNGNPFTDYTIQGRFEGADEQIIATGFYNGNGVYKVRFMPSYEGEYHFRISGSFSPNVFEGDFTVTAPQEGNHGPVHVQNTYHFAYADGTPCYPIGTTCYVWELQSDERIRQTLESLKRSGFQKIRFCIFPKHYDYNLHEPRSYPYEGTPMDSSVLTKENFSEYTGKTEGNHWDFTRFHVPHFEHIESCILALQKLGIEADLIVMHPYDRWGFSQMNRAQDELYWRYVIARFSAYRNVWWSLANEYDLMKHKTEEDWEFYASLLCECDPYQHLRSIHNCFPFYDHTRPWITHCSIQRQDAYKTAELVNEWRAAYHKPVVLDEIAYEGDIQHGWGNITGEEMVRRFWEGACRGGYPGHGETYLSPDDVLWWSHGGILKGESWKRVNFLLQILREVPGGYLKPYERAAWDEVCGVPETGEPGKFYLYYYSFMRPSFREFYFDDSTRYQVEVIDTWNMTIEPQGIFCGKFKAMLPARPFMAVRIQKVK